MKKVYIHSAVCISAQNTFETDDFLDYAHPLSEKKIVYSIKPDYKQFIAASSLRRMAPGVKMGVTAAYKALQIAQLEQPDAIITGTGMGCIDDTEKFLNAIIDNQEAYLTPTPFIQSTHNTVGAQIALGLKCKAYNNTYVHASASFETALLDAHLIMQDEEEAKNILVGAVDELGTEIIEHVRMMEDKDDSGIQVPLSESAAFFVLSSEADAHAIQMAGIEMRYKIKDDDLNKALKKFLNSNNLSFDNIDVLMMGTNGDQFDSYYQKAATFFPNASLLHYKHLSGEFYTASSFGVWTGYEILKRQHIPEALISKKNENRNLKTVLLYNQFKGLDHSFILLLK